MAFGDLKGTLTASSGDITTPFSATGSVAVSVGDLVIAVFGEVTDLTVTDVSDDLGNTYTAQNAGTDQGSITGRMFYSRVTNAGTLTTISATCTASPNNVAFPCAVFEGGFATSPLDANPANTTGFSTTVSCPASGTLAAGTKLVIAWNAANSVAAQSATSPNILAINENTSGSQAPTASIGYQVVSTTDSVSPVFTAGSNQIYAAGTASFLQAAGGGAPRSAARLFRSKLTAPLLARR